jgi:hypothetical protein
MFASSVGSSVVVMVVRTFRPEKESRSCCYYRDTSIVQRNATFGMLSGNRAARVCPVAAMAPNRHPTPWNYVMLVLPVRDRVECRATNLESWSSRATRKAANRSPLFHHWAPDGGTTLEL